MPNLVSVLNDEIRRLARKETKAQIADLKSASSRHRKDIAALKRTIAKQDQQISRLLKHKPKSAVPAGAKSPRRFSPGGVAKHRAKLEISAADYAKLVGVSLITVYNWEKGKSRPQAAQLESLAAVRKLGKREAWAKLDAM